MCAGRRPKDLISAVESAGNTIDFLLSSKRDRIAASGFLQRLLWQADQFRPRVINVDGHPAYRSAIDRPKRSGELGQTCQCRRAPYLNDILEQDHRLVKKRIMASEWFRSVKGALNSIAGYEAVNIIREGQIRWVAKDGIIGQLQFVERTFGLAA